MLTLPNSTTDKLQLITAQNGAQVVVAYNDDDGTGAYPGGSQKTAIVSATTTDICGTPAASTVREVHTVSIKNTYAGAQAITVQQMSSAVAYPILAVTLLEGESLHYAHGSGWKAIDVNGNEKRSASSLAIGAGKTLTISNSLTFAGTDGITITLPTTDATLARTDAAQTFTGDQTFSGDIALNGGELTTTATTFNLLAANATTVNAFGAASVALNIGHASAAAAFAGGISIPTGKNVTGTGTAQVTGFATVSATTLTGTLSTAAQTNITSVGTLTGLVLGGNVTESGGARSITVTGNITGAAISGTTLTASGVTNLTYATQSNAANNTVTGYHLALNELYVRQRGNSAGISGVTFTKQVIGNAIPLEIYTIGAHVLSLGTNATERLGISATGAVTIPGTLGVTGNITGTGLTHTASGNMAVTYSTDSGNSVLTLTHSAATATNQFGINVTLSGDPNNTSNYFMKGLGNATERITLRANGGIANYSANDVNLSDANSKELLGLSPDYSDFVKGIEFQRYRYIDGDRELDGVTVQQVKKLDPTNALITKWDDKFEGVYEEQLQMRINSVVPRLIRRIEALEARP